MQIIVEGLGAPFIAVLHRPSIAVLRAKILARLEALGIPRPLPKHSLLLGWSEPLCCDAQLSQASIAGGEGPLCVRIQLHLFGGGGDGGSIPGRMDLVRTAKTHGWYRKQASRDDPSLQADARLSLCTLSNAPLQAPVVMCQMGNLFNREAVLKHLLSREKKPHLTHLKALRDIVEVKASTGGGSGSKDKTVPASFSWVCPVTGKPANGKIGFLVAWGCGCLVSQEAVAQLGTGQCCGCGRNLDPELDELIPIAPAESDRKAQYGAMMKRNAVLKVRRKAKRRAAKAQLRASGKVARGVKEELASNQPRKRAQKRVRVDSASAVRKEAVAALKRAKKSSQVYSSIFLSAEDIRNDSRKKQVSFISTKPDSLDARL